MNENIANLTAELTKAVLMYEMPAASGKFLELSIKDGFLSVRLKSNLYFVKVDYETSKVIHLNLEATEITSGDITEITTEKDIEIELKSSLDNLTHKVSKAIFAANKVNKENCNAELVKFNDLKEALISIGFTHDELLSEEK